MNILIVDDQIYVVAGIRKEICWEKLGIQEVFTAYSAQEARMVFEQHRIDIMLCDIEMPGESGLDLFAWVNGQGFDTACIFLTAHADFGYAQTALTLGSFDYILQPARYEEIENSILRAKGQIYERRKEKHFYDYGVQMYEERHRILESRVQEWYADPGRERQDRLFEDFVKLRVFTEKDVYVDLMLFHILRWKDSPWKNDLICDSCSNILEELLADRWQKVLTCRVEKNVWLMILYGREAAGEEAELEPGLTDFWRFASNFYGVEAAVYWDSRKGQPLYKKLLAVRRQKDNNVSAKAGVMCSCGETIQNAQVEEPDYACWENLLGQGMGMIVYEEAMAYLRLLEKERCLDRAALEKFYRSFERSLTIVERRNAVSWEEIVPDKALRQRFARADQSLTEMEAFLKAVTSFFSEEIRDIGRVQETVNKIKEYIHYNLDKDIKREDVASSVFMNPSYVSRMFKKAEGISLKDYIVQEKMAFARTLLQSSALPVSLVALKAGYSNFSHFSQVYKKMYGVSPTEERKK